MKIVIDLQACQSKSSRKRGIGRYSYSLTKAMLALRQDHEFKFALCGIHSAEADELEAQFESILPKSAFSRYYYPPDDYQAVVRPLLLQQHYAYLQPDVLHISSIFENNTIDATRLQQLKHLTRSATFYDLIPLIFKDDYLINSDQKREYYKKLAALQACDMLLAISECSRQDAIHLLGIAPDHIVNINAACDSLFQPLEISEIDATVIKQRFKINRDFVLYTGGIDPRKNIAGLINSYAKLPNALRQTHQLVIVCHMRPEDKEKYKGHVKKAGLLNDEVIFTDYVSDLDLAKLYNLCKLFIFPSLYEGFGLPVLEAMQCGAPVLTANNSSLSEIVRFQDALFNPKDADDMTRTLVNGLTNDTLRYRLSEYGLQRAKDFSWENSAKLALEAFSDAQQRKTITNVTQVANVLTRRKLAFFSPLPKQNSGISDYSAELLPHLARYFDIDLFIDDGYQVEDDWLIANFPIHHYNNYHHLHQNYDITLFQMGNSKYHVYMYDLILQYGGIVVMHDFYLGGMIHCVMSASLFEKEAEYSHAEALFTDWKDLSVRTKVIEQFPCNRRILERAQGILVHSQYSKNLMNKFYQGTINTPVRIVNQLRKVSHEKNHNLSKNHEKKALNIAENDFLICSFGILTKTKLNDLIIDAFIHSNIAKLPHVKLVFVGDMHIDPTFASKIKALQVKLPNQIIITGYVDDEIYQKYLKVADLAVQLRGYSHGETSRAVLDCLAYGVPLIVNAFATLDELPEEIVYKISADVTVDGLAQALDLLYENTELRKNLSHNALAHIKQHHDPATLAAEYAVALHELSDRHQFKNENYLIGALRKALIQHAMTDSKALHQIASYAIANNQDLFANIDD